MLSNNFLYVVHRNRFHKENMEFLLPSQKFHYQNITWSLVCLTIPHNHVTGFDFIFGVAAFIIVKILSAFRSLFRNNFINRERIAIFQR